MRRIALILVLISAIALPLSAGRVIPPDSVVYEYMDTLFLLEGKSMVTSSKPWTASVAENELGRINREELSSLSLKLYDIIKEELEIYSSSFDGYLELSPEIYIHTNEEFDDPLFWDYSFEERKPFADAGFSMLFDKFYISSGISLGYGKITNRDTFREITSGIGAVVPPGESISVLDSSYIYSKSFLFNLPEVDLLYLETPGRTSIGYDGEHFSLGYFRDELSWGRSRIGNFVFDDHIKSQDYIRLNGFDHKKSFDLTVLLLESDRSNRWATDFKDASRIMMAHKFSFAIGDALSLSLSENVMYKFIQPQLQYFNPAYIYHNLNNSDTLNALAHAEFEYLPFRSIRFYGQIGIDQAKVPTEVSGESSAFGALLGLDYALPLSDSYLKLGLECAITTPMLYRRDRVDFIVYQRFSTNYPYMKCPVFTYLGFPYGGDAVAAELFAEYVSLGGFSSSLDMLLVLHGGTNMLTCHSSTGSFDMYPDLDLPILSEGGFTGFRVSWDNRYRTELSFCSLEAFTNIALVYLAEDTDLQISAGISMML